MDLWLTLRVALRAMGKNKMRAGLTVLGVVIGIAAVTTMVSMGQSANGLVQGSSRPGHQRDRGLSRQPPAACIRPGNTPRSPPGLRRHARECPSVLAASPIVGSAGR